MIQDLLKGAKHLITYKKKNNDHEEISANYKKYFEDSKTNDKNRTKVEMAGVTKVYDNGIKALSNLSMTIEPGEFVVLLGPSGCGKTTLLRMIAGLEAISDGYIKFNDAVVNGISPKDREIAMVFQNYALYPFMTVSNNISFGLKNKLYSNNVYRKLKHDSKMAQNPNFDKIEDLKTELKMLERTDPYLVDSKKRFQRLLKTAKIHKDGKKIIEYTEEIEKLDEIILLAKQNEETLEKIESIKNELIEIKSPNFAKIKALKEELKTVKKSELKNEPESLERIQSIKEELEAIKVANSEGAEIDQEEVKRLLDEKYNSAKVWYDYIPQKIEEVTKMLGINMYTKRKPADLSGGQRQRVALARAISKQTGLFLYDEPLSNLDAKLRAKMRTEIRRIHNTLGSTSVYVTHDQLEAMSMADKIVVMNKGYIQQVGTPLELLEKPNNLFVAKFIGNTDVNIINVNIKGGKITTKGNAKIESMRKMANIDLPQKIVMAVRPEHVIVDPQIVSNFKQNNFVGKIVHKELLGNDVLLTTEVPKLGEVRIMSTISFGHKIGDKVKFVIDPNKIHFYDDTTGFNIFEKFDEQNEYAKKVWLDDVEERKKNIFLMTKEKQKIGKVNLLGLKMISPVSERAREVLEERKKEIDYGDQIKAH